MNPLTVVRAMKNDVMRGYYLAVIAGLVLSLSAFLPWLSIGDRELGGVPDMAGVWILGLGVLATILASLSLVTRKNSRHPLLVVGLAAFGILFVGERVMVRVATEHAWVSAQATAIVSGETARPPLEAASAPGLYLGLAASAVLVLFGLTIVVRRVSDPYPEPEDDDV